MFHVCLFMKQEKCLVGVLHPSACMQAPKLRVQAQQLTKRFSSAVQMGVLKNLESLCITHMCDENDVQVSCHPLHGLQMCDPQLTSASAHATPASAGRHPAMLEGVVPLINNSWKVRSWSGGFDSSLHCLQMAWTISDRAVSPALRCLQLAAARGATIPVGCRRMHPDFSHLERLSISADIFLCINFLCHLLPLRHAPAALNSALGNNPQSPWMTPQVPSAPCCLSSVPGIWRAPMRLCMSTFAGAPVPGLREICIVLPWQSGTEDTSIAQPRSHAPALSVYTYTYTDG